MSPDEVRGFVEALAAWLGRVWAWLRRRIR